MKQIINCENRIRYPTNSTYAESLTFSAKKTNIKKMVSLGLVNSLNRCIFCSFPKWRVPHSINFTIHKIIKKTTKYSTREKHKFKLRRK